jgi:DNA end-binding protein Ku
VIRETIREMNKVAIGRVVLTNREHIIALEPMDKGLVGTLLRYPYEVRSADEYFDEIQDVKVTKDMLDLAKHIVTRRAVASSPTSSRTTMRPRLSTSSTASAPASRSRPRNVPPPATSST